MSQLSSEAKESIVLKALNRGDESVKSIAQSHNIGYSTLQKWIKRYREEGSLTRTKKPKTGGQCLERVEQFEHILATSGLDDLSLGEYCRKHGLYSHQLSTWRESFMSSSSENNELKNKELRELKRENKSLQAELRRKEKALAEVSALLVLKKKADLIWGDSGDDSSHQKSGVKRLNW